mgnify:CR=1 FL=1
MESLEIYEKAKDELAGLKKQLGSDYVSIDMTNLDGTTKEMIITALQNVIHERYKDVEQMTLGVQ